MLLSLTEIHEFFHEYTILVPLFALIFAILLKGLIHAIKGRFMVHRMLGSGGMPSAHSTFVISLATAMGIKHGVTSDEFLMTLVFSIVVIYDAMNVRYQSGLHAKALNKLTHRSEVQLEESIGHTPPEALVGGLVGLLTAAALLGI